ncbi:MAG: hypothetical protein DMG05_17425 [Acidobacteria bacterium]|jgi:hypothetical protein|nr:MAG: hypothetical protein DMG05_17425 [Acidobacteriota bacterium]
MPGEMIVMIIVLPALFAMVGWIFWIGFDSHRRRITAKARSELQTKLLDRIGSGRELVEFSESEGGQRFIESLTMEGNGKGVARGGPIERILSSIQKGVTLTLFGLGFLFLGWKYRFDGDVFNVIGVIGLSLGIGFLVSAGISYRLSKSLGLISEIESGKRKDLVSQS